MADTPSAYRRAQIEARKRAGAIERQVAQAFERDVRRYADRVLASIAGSKRFTFDEINALTASLARAQTEFLAAVQGAVQNSRDLAYDVTLDTWDRASTDVARSVGMGVIRAPNTALAGAFAGLSGVYWETALVNSALGSAEELASVVRTALLDGSGAEEIARRVRPYVNGSASFADFVEGGKIDLRKLPPQFKGATRRMLVNARRIAFSELHNARREAEVQSYIRDPMVAAVRWTLSPNRGLKTFSPPDECDALATSDWYGMGAGIYPVDAVPPPPHPYDRCETLPITRASSKAHLPKPSPERRVGYEANVPNAHRLSPQRLQRIRDNASRTVGYAEASRGVVRAAMAEVSTATLASVGVPAVTPSLEGVAADVILGEKLSGQLGSNAGGWYLGGDGTKRYVKFYADEAQARGEALANDLYRRLGLNAPRSSVALGPNGTWLHAAEALEGQTVGSLGLTAERADRILDGFAADVLVGNWDAVGMGLDNVIETVDGLIARIDQGGAFLMRAQAGRKPVSLLEQITEWDGFTNPSINADYRRVFQKAGLSSADDLGERVADQVDRILALEKEVGGWPKYVERMFPGWKSADRKAVASMLEARTKLLTARAQAARVEVLKKSLLDDLKAGKKTAQAVLDEAVALLPAGQADAIQSAVTFQAQQVAGKVIDAAEASGTWAAARTQLDDLLKAGAITKGVFEETVKGLDFLMVKYTQKRLAEVITDYAGGTNGLKTAYTLKNIVSKLPAGSGIRTTAEAVEAAFAQIRTVAGTFGVPDGNALLAALQDLQTTGIPFGSQVIRGLAAQVVKSLPETVKTLYFSGGGAGTVAAKVKLLRDQLDGLLSGGVGTMLDDAVEAANALVSHNALKDGALDLIQKGKAGGPVQAGAAKALEAAEKEIKLKPSLATQKAFEDAFQAMKDALSKKMDLKALAVKDEGAEFLYVLMDDTLTSGVQAVASAVGADVAALLKDLESGVLSSATVQKKFGALRKKFAEAVYAEVEVLVANVGYTASQIEGTFGWLALKKTGVSKAGLKKAVKEATEKAKAGVQNWGGLQVNVQAPASSSTASSTIPTLVNADAGKAADALESFGAGKLSKGAVETLVKGLQGKVANAQGALDDLLSGSPGRISARRIVLKFEANDALDPGGAAVYKAARQDVNKLRDAGLITAEQAEAFKAELKALGDVKLAEFKKHEKAIKAKVAKEQAALAKVQVEEWQNGTPSALKASLEGAVTASDRKLEFSHSGLATWARQTLSRNLKTLSYAAIQEWVSGEWYTMSMWLRKASSTKPSPRALGVFRDLDHVLDIFPKHSYNELWRGDKFGPGTKAPVSTWEETRDALLAAKNSGGVYVEPSFWATSSSEDFARRWGRGGSHGIVWKFDKPKGVGVAVAEFGGLGAEYEVLMPRDTAWKVLDVQEYVEKGSGRKMLLVTVRRP